MLTKAASDAFFNSTPVTTIEILKQLESNINFLLNVKKLTLL
jgi:hypothetical protein